MKCRNPNVVQVDYLSPRCPSTRVNYVPYYWQFKTRLYFTFFPELEIRGSS